MDRAVKSWLTQNKITIQQTDTATALAKALNKSYTIYGCMLLLPHTAFTGPEWTTITANLSDETLQDLYKAMCHHLKVTHIAVNKPIPLHKTYVSKNSPKEDDEATERKKEENILRSPINFSPLFGSFGPSSCNAPPSESDFTSAFWVTAKQNSIYQTWAPLWTMFSRGNISEKARLLTLPSVLQAVEEGRQDGKGSAAVDLYAGIGYFAFSYVKAGVKKVLCWDLNGWSCEGLRRGAEKNGWGVRVCNGDGDGGEGGGGRREWMQGEEEFLVFNETNEMAPERVEIMRSRLPPIRHVNCGMLPSSRASLELAAKVLDLEMGCWVHVHENFLVEDILKKAEETRLELEGILRRLGREAMVELEFINRLKNYAPGVVHCVLDFAVSPRHGKER